MEEGSVGRMEEGKGTGGGESEKVLGEGGEVCLASLRDQRPLVSNTIFRIQTTN
jgi:hypothetical protein